MRASDFDFALPPAQIAQHPATPRDAARLYVLPRSGAPAAHAHVRDLPGLLPEGALLVVNDTRVIPARLRARKPTGGKVELLLIERRDEEQPFDTPWTETWTCLGGASKPLRPGTTLALDGPDTGDAPEAEILAVRGAEVDVRFRGRTAGGLLAVAERLGEIPLPPYITRVAPEADDRDRYQTVYARSPGAAAAPTAGLHFTPALLDALAARGIERAALTLHVGLGTFAPLRSDDVSDLDTLHAERYELSAATCDAIARARAAGRPVVAVGTTTVRALESAAAASRDGALQPGPAVTRLFIKPGFRFRVVDGMMTNFHLPRSTLLMLVAAFAGQERVLAAYADAVARGYRFFSYGDAMLIT